MTTNGNYTNGTGRRPAGGNGYGQAAGTRNASAVRSSEAAMRKRTAAKRKRKTIVFSIELVVLVAMVFLLFKVFRKADEGPNVVQLPTEPAKIEIAPQVQEDPVMKGYWNIALFGIDANEESQLIKGARSDSIMIASINLDTGDIKLVSVYRDTYLNIGNDYYIKCNTAYSWGGGEQAVSMLNANLDMDINDFIAIGYEGLEGIVDGLGGVYLDVDEDELKHINNYQYSIAKVLGIKNYDLVEKTGYQKLNGLQATAYCRIRYRAGSDFARAASQRELLMAIEEKAKEADLKTLTGILDETMKHVVTTLTVKDILPYLEEVVANPQKYKIVAQDGFPQPTMRDNDTNVGSKGSSVIPMDLEDNVVWLHEFLFDKTDYAVSDTVKEYSEQIRKETTPYMNKK